MPERNTKEKHSKRYEEYGRDEMHFLSRMPSSLQLGIGAAAGGVTTTDLFA